LTARFAFALGMGLLVLVWVAPLRAEPDAPEAPDAPEWQYDPENAREIFETCAGCHGRNAQGGKQGAYPRLAGLDEVYIARQLEAFKARKRVNIPMYPYATERELPPGDVRDIARLLSQIELPTELPPADAEMSALERLRAVQAVFNVARVEGDIERGARIYADECADCHGKEGWGDGDVPQLAGQYTRYLRRQIASFRSGERANEDMEDVLDGLDADDLEDVWAYLASRDD
jgi:cytochrome c553